MKKKSYLEEVLSKNLKKKKIILDFIHKFTVIEDIFVDKEIYIHSFKCNYPGCGICCSEGTSTSMDEIKRIRKDIDDIKKYLNISKNKRLNKINNIFYRKNYKKGNWRLRKWNSSCIFLMDNKLCSVHKYCIDNNIDWIKYHFNLCVTYPLRIVKEQSIIHVEEELKNKEYVLPCFKKDNECGYHKSNMLVYSMKEVIIDRFGEDFWRSLEKNREKYVKG